MTEPNQHAEMEARHSASIGRQGQAWREAERMNATLDRLTMLRAFQGARRLAKRKREPNWVFAMQMFGLGSTYARAMCKRMGVDPESTSAEQKPASPRSSTLERET